MEYNFQDNSFNSLSHMQRGHLHSLKGTEAKYGMTTMNLYYGNSISIKLDAGCN